MDKRWRLIVDDCEDAVFHLSSLEAIWRAIDEGSSPNTFLLRRLQPCVLIGASQDAAREVNLDECRRRGIPVVRRPSEGGAVYCDRDCLVFSAIFLMEERAGDPPDSALAVWGRIIASAFQMMGVSAEACFSGPNDILVGGRKVAGLTLTDWYGVRSFSGAILFDADVAAMEAVLMPSPEKRERHGAKRIAERITTLRKCLERHLEVREVTESLVSAIARERGINFERGKLSAGEREEALVLHRGKYGNRVLNLGEPVPEVS